MSKITYVNLSDLNLPAFQAHQKIPPDYLREITNSIKDVGIIEPLIVRNTDNGLEIVAGCIRYQCAKIAGLKAVPCLNMSLSPKAAEIVKLHENIKRVPLDHVDQGNTFVMMMETFEMTEQQVADSVGRTVGYVSQHISLVQVANELTKAVKDGSLSFSQARELMRVDDFNERKRLMNFCIHDGATVRVLQQWVAEYLRDSAVKPAPVESVPELNYDYSDHPIERFCEACNISVEISHIRQVIYCPACHQSIKQALFEESHRLSSDSPNKTS